MQFTVVRPDGRTERVQHIAYSVKQTGPAEWTAVRKRSGTILGRSFISEEHLRSNCDTMTEPAH